VNVLHVIDSLGAGGAERSLTEMLPSLAERGVSSTIVCLQHREEGFEGEVLGNGFDVRFLHSRRTPARVAELRTLIKATRPDVVHTSIFYADVTGRLAAVGTKRPVLTSLVNMNYGEARRRDPRVPAGRLRAVQAVDGWTARHLTSHFHAISYAVRDDARDTLGLPAERITVIERGRDVARLGTADPARRAQSRRQLGLAPDAEVVVHVGRQEYQKGITRLLDAIAQLAPTRPRLVLVQAGRRGSTSAELEAAVETAGLAGRVRFLGHRDDVADILAAGDVFAFPSVYEGLGGAVIEAMALGLPIIATRIPPMVEILDEGNNADLVPVEAPRELAQAIAGLLDDDARRVAYGRRSRQIFEERFTLERVVDRMVTLYESVGAQAHA
jgi:glycosyltransferase involved in cell wall biosynthesis